MLVKGYFIAKLIIKFDISHMTFARLHRRAVLLK